ncbi:hypothetical protein F5Y17DRAFT_432454 [Xylariaceae sp. FL0594]|nr:hypothetical protein F5Y17DRAFT_432454 [Xylariaceae sp. FL0594]
MSGNEERDPGALEHLKSITGDPDMARHLLEAYDWNIDSAIQAYFENVLEENENDENAPAAAGPSSAVAAEVPAPTSYPGPTSQGRSAPQATPTTSSAASKRPQKKKGLHTFSSLTGDSSHSHGQGHGHGHGDDDDDDDDDDSHRETFAGGEKSGLALQDSSRPSDSRSTFNDLIARARSESQRREQPSAAEPSSSSAFRGSGIRLGEEGSESPRVPTQQAPPRSAPARLTLHRWGDGFSINDGQLYRFDSPTSASILNSMRSGTLPANLNPFGPGQEVEVSIEIHDENYPKKPFSGEGRRLGSPVPGVVPSLAAATSPAPPTSTAATSSTAVPSTSVDESQPTVTIRIQLLGGTRLSARFNTTQTVNDIYDFISRASPELRSGGWVLATTFPNKDHTDKSLVIGDMPEFKKGGTAVVKKT